MSSVIFVFLAQPLCHVCDTGHGCPRVSKAMTIASTLPVSADLHFYPTVQYSRSISPPMIVSPSPAALRPPVGAPLPGPGISASCTYCFFALFFSSWCLSSFLGFPSPPCSVLTPCLVVERHPFGVCSGSPNWASSA